MARHFAFDDQKQDQESASSSSFSHITHERILKVLNKWCVNTKLMYTDDWFFLHEDSNVFVL